MVDPKKSIQLTLGMWLYFLSLSPLFSSPFRYRGIVEGFYGKPYTMQARRDLLLFSKKQGANLYLYGPKDDLKHRQQWKSFYPAEAERAFRKLIVLGKASGVRFCYGLSPGVSIRFASQRDWQSVYQKLARVLQWGGDCVSLFFDDIPLHLKGRDRSLFQSSAEAQAKLVNATYQKLAALRHSLLFIVVPTEYAGTQPSAYKSWMKKLLRPEVLLMWTGPAVISRSISKQEAERFARVYGRKPLIWDNYPVNDYQPYRLPLAAYQGREESLSSAVLGILSNPALQPYASRLPLYTFFDYLRAPSRYQPQKSFQKGLKVVAGKASPWLKELALQSQKSGLGGRDDTRFRKQIVTLHRLLYRKKKLSASFSSALLKRFRQMIDTRRELKKSLSLPLWKDLSPFAMKLSQYGRVGLLLLEAQAYPEQKANKRQLFDQLSASLKKSPVRLCQPACNLLLRDAQTFFRAKSSEQ